MSKKYLNFSAGDFATDDSFRSWVFEKEHATEKFWIAWIERHPEKRQEVVRAVALLKTLQSQEEHLSENEIGNAIDRTMHKLDSNLSREKNTRLQRLTRWAGLAAAITVFMLAWWGTARPSGDNRVSTENGVLSTEDLIFVENKGVNKEEQLLPDGSKVSLNPGSSIKFKKILAGERTVFLSGGAFFDVVKKSGEPFRVITDDLETEVLGTSFEVSSDKKNGKTKVRVVTGRVEVSARGGTTESNNTVLYPNQEIIYTQDDRLMTKTIVSNPLEVRKPLQKDYVYESVPIGQIFDELARVYGVRIRYDQELLAGCEITASFGNESFWEKLNLICRPVRARAEQENGEIIIRSEGCGI